MKTNEVEYFMSLSLPEVCTMQSTPEGNRYVLEVLAWPGCAATGPTRDDAGRALMNAKRNWLISRSKQGLDVPLPRSANIEAQTRTYVAALDISKAVAFTAALDNSVDVSISEERLAGMSLHEVVTEIIGAVRRTESDRELGAHSRRTAKPTGIERSRAAKRKALTQ